MFLNENIEKVGLLVHLFCFFILSEPLAGQSYPAVPESIFHQYEEILDLQVRAEERLPDHAIQVSQHPWHIFNANLTDLIHILIYEDKQSYDTLLKGEKERLKLLEQLKDSDPYKRWAMAEIKIHWAFIKLKFGDNVAAGWNIKQAYNIINENIESFPGFEPNLKSMALLDLLIGSVPQKYHWLLTLFGLEGNIERGIQTLLTLMKNSSELGQESAIIYGLFNASQYPKQKLIDDIRPYQNKYGSGALFRFMEILVLYKNQQAENALKRILDYEKRVDSEYPLHFLLYLKGKIYMQKQDYAKARDSFQQFITNYSGRNNIKDAYFQVFLSYWLQKNEKQAEEAFTQAKVSGAAISSADKYATSVLRSNQLPNPEIMKIRLATDGGYFDLASKLINGIKSKNLKSNQERAEFVYRKARLFHLDNKIDDAIPEYLETIRLSENQSWYFAPNAALQLGLIHLDRNNRGEALKYLNLVFEYSNYPYKNNIDQQARIAIERTKSQDP